jgi:hypothetical protein
MSGQFGYNQLFTDRPETWIADGYVSIAGSGAPTLATVPSGVVSSVTRISTGLYKIVLAQNWFALLHADVKSEIPSSLSPAYVGAQLVSDTVGTGASAQELRVQFNVAGTPTDLPSGSGFRFLLLLKKSSA